MEDEGCKIRMKADESGSLSSTEDEAKRSGG